MATIMSTLCGSHFDFLITYTISVWIVRIRFGIVAFQLKAKNTGITFTVCPDCYRIYNAEVGYYNQNISDILKQKCYSTARRLAGSR